MNNYPLISAILRGKWLLEPVFSATQGPIIQGMIDRHEVIEKVNDDEPKLSAKSNYVSYINCDNNNIASNSTAVIQINGVLMKYDQLCGPMGMASISNYIKKADENPNIDRIVLVVDSPGGTVDGTEALANVIKSATTETVTLIDGQMCSAALWIGSSSDKVYSTSEFNEVGSVGVVLSFVDMKPMYEAKGIKFHNITATTSPDKTKLISQLYEGKYDEYRKEVLDPLDAHFMNTIRENCPNVKEEHLTGKVYFAKDVLGVFVDEISTLDEILDTPTQGTHSNTDIHSNNNSMEQLTFLASLFGAANLSDITADAEGDITLNSEQLEAVNVALENFNSTSADASETEETADPEDSTDNDTADIEAERDQAIEAQQIAEKALATANARVAELEARPGAQTATAISKTDANTSTNDAQKMIETANALIADYQKHGSLI